MIYPVVHTRNSLLRHVAAVKQMSLLSVKHSHNHYNSYRFYFVKLIFFCELWKLYPCCKRKHTHTTVLGFWLKEEEKKNRRRIVIHFLSIVSGLRQWDLHSEV